MRLICPKCAAQYQVPDDAIPRTGRDVQCSNCGETWYAMRDDDEFSAAAAEVTTPPPRDEHELEEPTDAEFEVEPASPPDTVPEPPPPFAEPEPPPPFAEPEPPPPDAEPEPPPVAEPEHAQEPREMAVPEPADDAAPEPHHPEPPRYDEPEVIAATPDAPLEVDPDEGDIAASQEIAGDAMAGRRALAPDVARILREEAEREAQARRAAAETFEDQPDLGVETSHPDPTPIDTPDYETHLQPEAAPLDPPEAEVDQEPTPAAPDAMDEHGRDDSLPDPDAINSSLRRKADRPPPPSDEPSSAELEERDWRRGFRMGFGVVLLIALGFALVYVLAPRISEAVPALAPALDDYVATVDTARFGLDTWMQNMLGGAGD